MTPFQQEGDGRRPELRRASGGNITWWPKADGANVALAGAPQFTIHTPAGNQIQAGASAFALVDGYTRVDVPVNAIDARDCGYQVRLLYQVAGEAIERRHVVPFDVVEWPLEADVSLNALLGMRPQIGRVLEKLGSHLDPPLDAAAMGAHFVEQAVTELDARLRSQIRTDVATTPSASRPSVILNRGPINRFVRNEAMRLIFLADGTNPEGDNEQAALLRTYAGEAESAWRTMGTLEYDTDGDLVVDSEDRNRTRIVRSRRSW